MRVLSLSSSVALAALAATSRAAAPSVGAYIAAEAPVAAQNMLANIGSSGSRAPGAFPGVVVASPSTVNPNYYYSWIRDSSLVFKLIIDTFVAGQTSLRPLVDDFTTASQHLQGVANPSGGVASGNNLGEPKFYVNETAFEGSWGRPQRDGPALRATALSTYATYLLSHSNTSYVSSTLYPVIEKDLNYVMNNWNQSTFDLWEEVSGRSFFTTAVQHRALRTGAALAKSLGQNSDASAWAAQADNALCFLQSFWNPSGSYITANVGQRSGLDANTVLASIHTFDPAAGCDAATFQPCSDKALANLHVYVESFRTVYPLNAAAGRNAPIAVGRYPEDVYYNGNPWYLANFAVAEQLYDALYVWTHAGSLKVTSLSAPFFSAVTNGTIAAGTYASSSATYKTITAAVQAYADGFVAINAHYTPSDGSLSEQFDKGTGVPTSAVHLTWSYASAITAFNARNTTLPPASWGAAGLKVPASCKPGPAAPTASVTFRVNATTSYGENVFLTGSVDALANWSPDAALTLSAAAYPVWSVTAQLPVDTQVQYKYIRKEADGSVVWESDPNMQITTPASGSMSTADVWR